MPFLEKQFQQVFSLFHIDIIIKRYNILHSCQ
jgi:hypothetical protein